MFFMPPMSLGLTRYSRAGGSGIPFDPSILFSNGEQGGWYDPSDLTTLFQDAIGTVPVTADGQPVGLMLDKHEWGGQTLDQVVAGQPERVTNGDFSDGSTGWTVSNSDATHTITFSDGTMRYQSDTITPVLELSQPGVLQVGKRYEVTTVCSAHTSGSIKSDALGGVVLADGLGTKTVISVATASNFAVVRNSANVDLTLDSFSVKEIPGNHASQAATAARPTYREYARRHLESDGVDDALNVSLPAESYTRAYVTAAGVMTIDEGVAIIGPENVMREQTIAGVVYIDRALTSDEKANLAAYWGATL